MSAGHSHTSPCNAHRDATCLHPIIDPSPDHVKAFRALFTAHIARRFRHRFPSVPRVRYKADLLDRQLGALPDSQGMTEPIDAVGLSMGGAIAAHFLDRHPGPAGRLLLSDQSDLSDRSDLSGSLMVWPETSESGTL